MRIGPSLPLPLLGQQTLANAGAGASFAMSFETLLATSADQRGGRVARAFGFEELGVLGLNGGIAAPGGEHAEATRTATDVDPLANVVTPPTTIVDPAPRPVGGALEATASPTPVGRPNRAERLVLSPTSTTSAAEALAPLQRRGPEQPGGGVTGSGGVSPRLLQKLPVRPVRPVSEVNLRLERTPEGVTVYAVAGRLDPDEIARLRAEADDIVRSHGELLSEFNFNGIRQAVHANLFWRP